MKQNILGTQEFFAELTKLMSYAARKGIDVTAVTGHRLDKLVGPSGVSSTVADERKTAILADFIFQKILPGDSTTKPVQIAHIGGADGVDTAFGLALVRAKRKGADVKIVVHVPMHGHPDWFKGQQKVWYDEIIEAADLVGYCLDRPTERGLDTTKALHSRNNCMLYGPVAQQKLLEIPDAPFRDFEDPRWASGNVHRLIAFQRGDPTGGTAQCMRTAQKRGVRIETPWQAYQAFARAQLR